MVIFLRYGWQVKNNKRLHKIHKTELQKVVLKSLLYSKIYPFFFKLYFVKLYHTFSKITSLSSVRNICGFGGSGRAVLRTFSLSRHFFKKFAANGNLLGLRKSSF